MKKPRVGCATANLKVKVSKTAGAGARPIGQDTALAAPHLFAVSKLGDPSPSFHLR